MSEEEEFQRRVEAANRLTDEAKEAFRRFQKAAAELAKLYEEFMKEEVLPASDEVQRERDNRGK